MEDADTQRVVIPYSPRPQFLPFHNRTQRFSAIVAHRRAGKTVACVNDLIKAAILCPLENPRFAYIAPYFTQAKDIAWNYVKHYTQSIPGVETNESELRVDLPNGGRVRLYGAENYDRLRGIYLDGVVLDEPADIDPRAWPEVIRPALSDRKGWACFIGTPKGRNAFYEIWAGGSDGLWKGAINDPEWFALMLKASETGILDATELADARKIMSADQYEQEYECSFQAAIQGAYYGREMTQAEAGKRICRVPWEPNLKTHTAWDLGVGDSTAIWFVQQLGQEIRVIDYYESSGVGLDHYAKVLGNKPYVYGEHILPHDVSVKEMSTGRSREETLRSLGIRPKIIPAQNVDDGINAARLLIPRCWFDADNCKRGIEALRQYRRHYDEKLKNYRSSPLHDWTSHAADAFRYLALGLKADKKQDWSQPSVKWVVSLAFFLIAASQTAAQWSA